MLIFLVSCNIKENENQIDMDISNDDIAIVYTNDIHGAVNKNIGMDGLYEFKQQLFNKTKNVITVDCGDSNQGNYLSKLSNGAFVSPILNKIKYDYCCLGNHEFDFGIENTDKFIKSVDAKFLCQNLKYTGYKDLFNTVIPFDIKEINNKKIAFIGIDTPSVDETGIDNKFKENGKYVMSFGDRDPLKFYKNVQNDLDLIKSKGADIVILLSHLGETHKNNSEFSSNKLIENVSGINAVIDGHTHSKIDHSFLRDKNNNQVVLTSAEARLKHIGLLKITKDNQIETKLISNFNKKNKDITTFINNEILKYGEDLNDEVCSSDIEISYLGEGNMYNSSREDIEGNLIADAYKNVANTDCALVNATEYRSFIPKGKITKQDLNDIFVFNDSLKVSYLKGQDILDALEHSARKTKNIYEDHNGNAEGSCADFLQVSGLKFEIDTSITSGVNIKGTNEYVSTNGQRRIKNCQILKDGIWLDLNSEDTYSVVSSGYLASGGCGMTMLARGTHSSLDTDEISAVSNYINNFLNNKLSENYNNTDNRIKVY